MEIIGKTAILDESVYKELDRAGELLAQRLIWKIDQFRYGAHQNALVFHDDFEVFIILLQREFSL